MERVTGKSYDELMKEEVFDKLLMNNSGSYFHTQIIKNRAAGYDYNLADFASSDFRDQSNTMGTGDVYSTVEDLFKFHLSITNGTLLNKNLTTQMLASGLPPAQYGYGWFNKNFKYTNSDTVAANFHLGMTDGFVSFMLRIPEKNSCVIILCNSSPTDFFGIVGNLVKVLYGKPVKIKKPVHKQMEMYISKIGAKLAVDEYYRLKKDTANYYIDWISMNFIAEQLLKQKMYDEAKIISENNVIEFSNKDLIMVTMGNIYLALNRKEEAIIYYKKTLEINPNYEEAKNRLKDLGQKIN